MNHKLLIFTKAPVTGQVKTRLIPALGEKGAATIQRQLLHQTLQTAKASDIPTELWCTPNKDNAALDEYRQPYDVIWKNQHGSDLGERMLHAFSEILCSVDTAILIGTDCPELQEDYLHTALEKLGQDNDVVLGPAHDGGYVLIGLKQALPSLFENIPWGTGQVLSATREKIRQLKLNWRELPPMHDLDRPSDLKLFPDLLAKRI